LASAQRRTDAGCERGVFRRSSGHREDFAVEKLMPNVARRLALGILRER
jgi:hypothetical protein